jgi:hypothetical protein
MRYRVCLLCFVLSGFTSFGWVTSAAAQEKVPPAPGTTPRLVPEVTPKSLGLPETVSPMIGFYQGVDQKEKKIRLAFVESIAEVVTRTVMRNGVEELVEATVYKPTAITGGVPFADIQFFNTLGQKLKIDTVVAKLNVGDPLIISGDEKPLSPAYLKVIKADAIIVIFPLDPFIEPFLGGPEPGVPVPPVPK